MVLSILTIHTLAKVYSHLSDTRSGFELLKKMRGTRVTAIFEDAIDTLEAPMQSIRLLGWAGSISGAHRLKHQVTKLSAKRNRWLERTLRIGLQLRVFANATAGFIKGLDRMGVGEFFAARSLALSQSAFKIAVLAATPLSIVGSALSIVYTATHSYEYYQSLIFLREWKELKTDEELIDFIKNHRDRELSAIFHLPAEKVIDFFETEGMSPETTHQRKHDILESLEKRIQHSLHHKKVMLLGDTLYAIGSWGSLLNYSPLVCDILRNASFVLLVANNAYWYHSAKNYVKEINFI